MTDRIVSLNVVLEREVREDDCESLVNAIKMLKGVLNVEKDVADIAFYTARSQAKLELMNEIRDKLNPFAKH